MKILPFILALSFSTAALAESTKKTNFPDHFAFGIGFGLQENGKVFNVDLQSPKLFSYSADDSRLFIWRAFLDLGTHELGNKVTDENGKLKDAANTVFALGLMSLTPASDDLVTSYFKFGAVMFIPDNEISDKDQLFGARVTFGIELPTKRAPLNTFFTEGSMTGFVPKADKFAGKPDLFNGFEINVGVRSFY